jgi:ribosome biogenesis protein ENP2
MFWILGIYPPQVKVFELKELSEKFERHLISEIINFEVPLSKILNYFCH